MIKHLKRLLAVLAVFAFAPAFILPSAARASTLDFSALYFFGDSLSDTGNIAIGAGGAIPPPTTYAGGEFSNGPIWADYLAGHLGFAAPTPYLASPPPPPMMIVQRGLFPRRF